MDCGGLLKLGVWLVWTAVTDTSYLVKGWTACGVLHNISDNTSDLLPRYRLVLTVVPSSTFSSNCKERKGGPKLNIGLKCSEIRTVLGWCV